MNKTIIFSLIITTFTITNCFSISWLFRTKNQLCYPTIEIKNKTNADLDIEAKIKNAKSIHIPKTLRANASFRVNSNEVDELFVGHNIQPGCANPGFFDGIDLIEIVKQEMKKEIEMIEQLGIRNVVKLIRYKVTIYVVKKQFGNGYAAEVQIE